jgi:hypothetical protein
MTRLVVSNGWEVDDLPGSPADLRQITFVIPDEKPLSLILSAWILDFLSSK